ncbi:hypothetical protein [Neobacillus drentensis]
MKDGDIIECGNHEELLSNNGFIGGGAGKAPELINRRKNSA